MMSFGVPLLVSFIALMFWLAAIAKFDWQALVASLVATIVSLTLWIAVLAGWLQ